MEKARIECGMTKADLSREAKMQASVIGWIESERFIPYDSQLEKIAKALCWKGELSGLLERAE